MKNNKVILLVLMLVIGFAAVSTTLILNGTLNIGFNTPEFDVYFSNAIEDGVENKKLIKDDTHISFIKDMTLKDETYTLDYDVTNGSRNYDASLTISCTESNEYIEVTNTFDTTTNLPATETRSGKLAIKVIKPYVGTEEEPTKNIEVTCTITGTPVERESLATGTPNSKVEQVCEPQTYENGVWKYTDNDCSGDLTKNDLITLDTESFYVYDIEGDNVKAIAQYNLYVGNSCTSDDSSSCTPLENPTGLQDATALGYINGVTTIGVVAYDSEEPYSNVYETSEIKPYVEAYKTKLEELNGNIIEARLITKEELEKIGCIYATCESAPTYIYSTVYWTLTPLVVSDGSAWSVSPRGNGWRNLYESNSAGVRPVIELSKSLFE